MTVEQVDAQFKLVEQIHNLRAECAKKLDRALAEIERLRSIAFSAEEDARMLRAEMAQAEQNWAADWKREFDNLRNQTIEQCAQVIEQWENDDTPRSYLDLIAAIRAFKG